MVLSTPQKGILYTLGGAISWGLNGAVTQYFFMNYAIHSAWLTSMRMIFAGAIIILLVLPTERRQFLLLFQDPHEVLRLGIVGVFGLLWAQYSYLTAIKYSNSGTATVLQTLSIVLMAIYLALRHRSMPPRREIIAIILAGLGVFLSATNGSMSSLVISVEGLFWGIMAAIGAVTYPLLSHDLAWRWHTSVINGPSMMFGGFVLLLAVQGWQYTPVLDGAGWAALLFIIIVGTATSFTCIIRGIHLIGPMKVTLLCTLEPVIAAATSAVWLDTVFLPIELIGFALILLTVFIIVRPEKPVKQKE